MAQFPTLKTSAVAQYPSDRSELTSTAIYKFVDGTEQRYPRFGSALRRWVLRMERLDDGELFELEEFFKESRGASGVFAFTDPWDGVEYPNCSLESDVVTLAFLGPGAGKIELIVRENR